MADGKDDANGGDPDTQEPVVKLPTLAPNPKVENPRKKVDESIRDMLRRAGRAIFRATISGLEVAYRLILIIVIALGLHHVCDLLVVHGEIVRVTFRQLADVPSLPDLIDLLYAGGYYICFRTAEYGLYLFDLYFLFRTVIRHNSDED